MAHIGKRYAAALTQIERGTGYTVEEAIATLRKTATAKFDETVEMALRLGVDPKHADQMVRGAVVLPRGTG